MPVAPSPPIMALESALVAAAFTVLSAQAQNTTFTLATQYSGQSFFNGWEYYGNYDNLTNGACSCLMLSSCDALQRGPYSNRFARGWRVQALLHEQFSQSSSGDLCALHR